MKALKKIFTVSLFMMLFSMTSYSQNSSLNFTIESQDIEFEEELLGLQSTLIIKGDEFIWTQHINNREHSSTYKIIKTDENWDSNNSTGRIEYLLDLNGFQSALIITGSTDKLEVVLMTNTDNVQSESYSFQHNTITFN